jgi:hypothetical protein
MLQATLHSKASLVEQKGGNTSDIHASCTANQLKSCDLCAPATAQHLNTVYCDAPDDVEVTGIVRAQWRPLFPGARCDGTLAIKACHVRSISSRHRAAAPPTEGLQEQFR